MNRATTARGIFASVADFSLILTATCFKKGNSARFQFHSSETYHPYTQTATIRVALADLPPCYVIAAHAEVHKVVNGVKVPEETVWSFDTPFRDTDRWGWTSDYCTQVCK